MSLRRWRILWKAYFSGIISEEDCFSELIFNEETGQNESVLERRNRDWELLTEKEDFVATLHRQSTRRRASMYETATRSSYLLVALAFAAAVDAALLIASGSGAERISFKLSLCLLTLSTLVLIDAISAKSKVMKKPRIGGESEPDEMLHQAVAVQRAIAADASQNLVAYRDKVARQLQRRKQTLVVERRAQWVAAALMARGGLLAMIVGIILW